MIDESLINYIESPSRNKIILSTHEIKGIKYIDMGVLLSEALSTIPFQFIPYELDGILDSIFRTNFKESYMFGKYCAITNINILFEPELSINFTSLLDKYSKDIKNLEKKLTEAEDRYYKKFAAMEKAMAQLNSSGNAISGLFQM